MKLLVPIKCFGPNTLVLLHLCIYILCPVLFAAFFATRNALAYKCQQQRYFKEIIKAIQIQWSSFKIGAKIEVRENFDCGSLREWVCLCRVVSAYDQMRWNEFHFGILHSRILRTSLKSTFYCDIKVNPQSRGRPRDKILRVVRISLLISAIQKVLRFLSWKLFYKSNRKLFPVFA